MRMDSAVVGGLAGLGGIVVGALLQSLLTTRRERWNLKRDLYTRLLENLGKAKTALDGLWEAEAGDPARFSGEWSAGLVEQEASAVAEITRAASVAGMMLNRNTVEALESLQREWGKARRAHTMFEEVDHRLAAVGEAYRLVLAAARRDLRLSWK